MYNIYDLVTLEFINEHNLKHRRIFTTPKIQDANGDFQGH